MKKFYTIQDVELAVSMGKSVIELSDGDVITSLAQEEANKKGITFSYGKVVRTSTVGSKSKSNKIIAAEYKGLISEQEVDQWRKEFPILENVIHVANCSQSAQSKRVRGAITSYLDNWLTVGMDWEQWVQEVYLAKVEFAKLINASPDEIAITTSVSEAVSSIAGALDYSGSRNKVVVTDAEFPTVNYVWLANQKSGAKVDFIAVNDNHEIELSEYERYIDETTLITSVTQVYYLNGFKQDLKAISDIAHRKGSLLLADCYQGLGTEPVDVKAMNIDILTSGNLKYLFGIPGVAFLYVNKDLVSKLKPTVTGWFGQDNPFLFQSRYLDWASDTRRFETGTPPIMTSYAAREGLAIINEVGVDRIKDRIDMLSEYALELCLERDLDLVSPLNVNRKGGTTAIKVSHIMDSHELEHDLRVKNIIASARGEYIRVAPHFYNKKEELKIVFDEIKRILDSKRV